MKKTLLTLLILAIIGGGAYLYITRPGPTPSVENTPVDAMTSEQPAPIGTQLYMIDASKSEAKFEVNEVLMNNPFHVVGVTSDVAGQININTTDPKMSTVGTISINARTLKTDSEKRNGMLGRMILKSETNEFITFTPKNSTGLPEKVEIGKDYTFKTTGTLTISGVSKDVTFDVTVKVVSATQISGVAKTTIKYKDFDITIPKVPMVASVEENVDLTFTFVAEKK